MSWLASEWKSDLSPLALRKVEELEEQLARMKKDAQQKTFQLENLKQVRTILKCQSYFFI
jgi:hypothetical protein